MNHVINDINLQGNQEHKKKMNKFHMVESLTKQKIKITF